ncbi:MAG: FtsX-like permease family protein [Bacteroidia bacterium]|nr:FtsX-like permease family protein [Bacteroidia bacterium]
MHQLRIACPYHVSVAASGGRHPQSGGCPKKQLVYQFGVESILLAFISMVIGFGLVVAFLPAFNDFTSKGIELTWPVMTRCALVMLAITLLVGLLAGGYPSFFLSRFLPATVLKGRFTSRLQAGFTKPLVVIQFFLSASMIISSVIMYKQMRFVATKDLGYNKNQVVRMDMQMGWSPEADVAVDRLRSKLSADPEVMQVAGVSSSFNHGWSRYGYKIKDENKSAYVYRVDPEYVSLFGIEIVAGRNFDEARASDSTAIIVNEALVKDMAWTDPLNEYLNWREDSVGPGSRVIGVVKDYNFLSLEREIEPLFLSMDPEHVGYLSNALVKFTPGDLPGKIEKLRKVWLELYPDKPFDYSFVDDDVARQYELYQRWMMIMGLSTIFAIIIACLGLFGLAGINVVNRTKEIGIRKVMGAEVSSIFVLLNRQYVWLALIAFSLAAPCAWYLMSLWLSSFKYSITMSWDIFILSMLAGLVIALATVSYHAVRAALVNPAETLKYE